MGSIVLERVQRIGKEGGCCPCHRLWHRGFSFRPSGPPGVAGTSLCCDVGLSMKKRNLKVWPDYEMSMGEEMSMASVNFFVLTMQRGDDRRSRAIQ